MNPELPPPPDTQTSDPVSDRPAGSKLNLSYAVTLGHLPIAALLTVVSSGLISMQFGLGLEPTIIALVLFGLLIGLVVITTPLPQADMGAGNRVTLARLALVCLIGGIVAAPAELIGDRLVWTLLPIAVVAALLDALDGAIARSTHSESAFGARLDMEADALFIAILAVLLWHIGKIGVWVIAIGALRYVFLAAMLVWTALRAPLPASKRRQAICVVQVIALLAALTPAVSSLAATLLAGVALALLVWSFGTDIQWLVRNRARTTAPET